MAKAKIRIKMRINNINNTTRQKLLNEYGELYDTPYKVQKNFVNDKFFDTFGLYYIDSTLVILNDSLFNKKDN